MYQPILDAAQLPRSSPSALVGETDLYDFKLRVDLAGDAKHTPQDVRADLAKDMASFANARGGTIIVGAREERDAPRYLGIEKAEAAALHDAYDRAANHLCSPSPRIVARELIDDASGGALILVINVDPIPGAAVGCRHPDHPDRWRFPMRVGREPEFLTPERLPMLIDARHRRLFVLIASIGAGEEVAVVSRTHIITGVGPGVLGKTRAETPARLVSVDATTGCVVLEFAPVRGFTDTDSPAARRLQLPIDDVETVWREDAGWRMRIVGYKDD